MNAKDYYNSTRLVETNNWTLKMALNFADEYHKQKNSALDNLPPDEELKDFVKGKSQLYTAYSVKNKDGEFTSVIDVDSVVELLKSLKK